MDDEKKSVQTSQPYTITTSIIENQLTIILDDNNAKQQYKSTFTPQLLKKCGFNDKQIKNLSAIKKLIQTAEAGHNDWKLTISIDNGKKDAINIDDDDDPDDAAEGGVHGIDDTKSKDIIAPAAVSVELAVITITKEDDFLSVEFILKLAKVEREQSQINADIIRDMMMEISAIRQKLEESEQKARGQEEKIVKLEEITKLQAADIEDKTKGISGLIARVEVLEQKADAQRNLNKKLEDDVLEKESKIEELKGKIRGYDGRIGGLEQGLDKRGKEIKILNDGKDKQGKDIKDLVEITKSQEGKIGKLEKETKALGEEQKEEDGKSKVHIAKYASSKEADHIEWDVVKIKPTLDGMISKMEDSNNKLYFGVGGLYRIVYRWTSTKEKNTAWANVFLNENIVAESWSYKANSTGEITQILSIKPDDYIRCYCNGKIGTHDYFCSLIIERLCDCL